MKVVKHDALGGTYLEGSKAIPSIQKEMFFLQSFFLSVTMISFFTISLPVYGKNQSSRSKLQFFFQTQGKSHAPWGPLPLPLRYALKSLLIRKCLCIHSIKKKTLSCENYKALRMRPTRLIGRCMLLGICVLKAYSFAYSRHLRTQNEDCSALWLM